MRLRDQVTVIHPDNPDIVGIVSDVEIGTTPLDVPLGTHPLRRLTSDKKWVEVTVRVELNYNDEVVVTEGGESFFIHQRSRT